MQAIECAAVHHEDRDEVDIFIINRSAEDDIEIDLDARGFEGYKLAEHIEMYTDDLEKANSYGNPDAIRPVANTETKMENGRVSLRHQKAFMECDPPYEVNKSKNI